MMKAIALTTILLALVIIPSVAAQTSSSTNRTCIDNMTMQEITSYKFTVNSLDVANFSYSKNVQCAYGCDSTLNGCKPDAGNSSISVAIIGFGIVSLVFAYLGLNLKSDKMDRVIRLIFIAMSLFFIALTIAISATVSSSAGATASTLNLINMGVSASNYVIWIFLALVMIGFLLLVINYFIAAGKKAREIRH